MFAAWRTRAASQGEADDTEEGFRFAFSAAASGGGAASGVVPEGEGLEAAVLPPRVRCRGAQHVARAGLGFERAHDLGPAHAPQVIP